jgi:outer membrane protein OmpA-like peptidoglycan-associated protein
MRAGRLKFAGWGWVVALALAGCQSVPSEVPKPPEALLAERRAQALRDLGFTPQPGGEWALSLSTSLLFDFDSDQLRPLQQTALQRIGATLAEVGIPMLRVEGHSDGMGDAAYNQKLSLRRALAVSRVLEAAGLRDRLRLQGLGNSRPIADNATEAGRAQNRRVVLIAASL